MVFLSGRDAIVVAWISLSQRACGSGRSPASCDSRSASRPPGRRSRRGRQRRRDRSGLASRAATGGLVLCFEDREAGGRGVASWYGVHLQERLDGGVDVIRCWGRLGVSSTRPRQLVEPYPDWTAARDALPGLLSRRAARGYRWA